MSIQPSEKVQCVQSSEHSAVIYCLLLVSLLHCCFFMCRNVNSSCSGEVQKEFFWKGLSSSGSGGVAIPGGI